MDKLTFLTLATHHPDVCVIDVDGDTWHAGCLAKWLGKRLGEQRPIVEWDLQLHTPSPSDKCYCVHRRAIHACTRGPMAKANEEWT